MNGYTILRVELEDGSESAYAEYSSFSIADENDKYRIHVSGYSGTAGKRRNVLWIIGDFDDSEPMFITTLISLMRFKTTFRKIIYPALMNSVS